MGFIDSLNKGDKAYHSVYGEVEFLNCNFGTSQIRYWGFQWVYDSTVIGFPEKLVEGWIYKDVYTRKLEPIK